MCTLPLAFGGLGLFQGIGQVQAQAAQADVQERLFDITKNEALRSSGDNFAQLNRNVESERKRIASELDTVRRQALSAQSTAAVSAGESGVSGSPSTELLLASYSRKRLEFETAKNLELEGIETNAFFQKRGIRSQARSRIASATPTVSSPNFLGSFLTIGGSTLSGVGTGLQIQSVV